MIDLVVVGGGQAGLAAGAAAAERGLRVTVLEKADRDRRLGALLGRDPVDRARRRDACGGCCPTATPSSAGCWSRASSRRSRRPVTRASGDRALDRAPRLRRRLPHRHPRAARALGVEDRRPAAEHAASSALLVDGGRVRGVVAGGEEIQARAVLLASGGFQGDKELVKRFLGWDADRDPRALEHAAASATASGSRSPRARRPAPASARSTATRSPRR